MSKRKHSPEWMRARVQEYLSGERALNVIAAANEMAVYAAWRNHLDRRN